MWLLIRDPSTRRTLWLSIIFALVLTALLDRILNAYWPLSGFALWDSAVLLFFLFAVFKIAAGRLAANHIAEAKENGILEAILASRLPVEQIVSAQFRAAITLLGWPLLALTILSIATFAYSIPTIDRLADTFTTPPEINEYRLRAAFILGIAVVFLFLDTI